MAEINVFKNYSSLRRASPQGLLRLKIFKNCWFLPLWCNQCRDFSNLYFFHIFAHCGVAADYYSPWGSNEATFLCLEFPFMLQDRDRRPEIDYGPVRNDPRCGLNAASRSVAQRRIVGGSEAGFGSFPWQAYIRIGKKTAAHTYVLCTTCILVVPLPGF